MKQRILSVDGVDTELLESVGQSDPIFLFHGNSSAANSFAPLLNSALGQRHRLVAVSFSGHGDSSPATDPAASYSIETMGRFAARVVELYGSSRYWLVGQSLGGHALIEGLRGFPGARGLLLVSAPPVSLTTIGQAFRPDPSAGCLFKGELSDDEVELLVSCFSTCMGAEDVRKLKDNIRRTDRHFRPALGASLAQGNIGDERQVLAGTRIPIAVAAGSDDKFLNAEYYATLPQHYLWRQHAHIFEGGGHLFHLEQPERFERLVAEFVSASAA